MFLNIVLGTAAGCHQNTGPFITQRTCFNSRVTNRTLSWPLLEFTEENNINILIRPAVSTEIRIRYFLYATVRDASK